MLAAPRQPVRRPADFNDRLRHAQEALRFIRVDDRGLITLLERESQPEPPNSGPLYPSFAALQLHLLNDRNFGAEYVANPIKFATSTTVDYRRSINAVRTFVRSLVRISRRVGDMTENDRADALRAEPRLYQLYPDVYLVLRAAIVTRLDALRGTVLNRALLDYIVDNVWTSAELRDASNLQNGYLALRSRLRSDQAPSRAESEAAASALAARVIDSLMVPLLRQAVTYREVAINAQPNDAVVRPPQRPTVPAARIKDEPSPPASPPIKPSPPPTPARSPGPIDTLDEEFDFD